MKKSSFKLKKFKTKLNEKFYKIEILLQNIDEPMDLTVLNNDNLNSDDEIRIIKRFKNFHID